jgi:dolichyl-phosphate beta-glucosyltransferase
MVRLILVDNGSSDYSIDEVLSSTLSDTPIRIVSCSTKGKGAAVRAGVSIATAPFVGYCDADLSVDPEAIGSGLSLLEAGWEVVIGSRRCPGAQYVVRQPVTRQLGSQAFRAAARPLTGAVRDTQCGFKLFHTPTAKALFAHNSVDGFAFDVEIVARALRQQRRIIELPLQWSDDSASSFHPISDGIRSFREMRGVYRSLRQPDIDLPRAV